MFVDYHFAWLIVVFALLFVQYPIDEIPSVRFRFKKVVSFRGMIRWRGVACAVFRHGQQAGGGGVYRRAFCAASKADDAVVIQRAKRRLERYKNLMYSLQMPHPGKFVAYGQEYGPLPFHASNTPLAEVEDGLSEERVQELVHYFEMSGSVMVTKQYGPVLAMTRPCHDMDRLFDLQQSFGGVIYRSHPQKGFQRPDVQWVIRGYNCQRAASILASVPSDRLEEFRLLADFPKDPAAKLRAADSMSALRVERKQRLLQSFTVANDQDLAKSFNRFGSCWVSSLMGVRMRWMSPSKVVIDSVAKYIQSLGLSSSVTKTKMSSRKRWYHVVDVAAQTSILALTHRMLPYVVDKDKTLKIIVECNGDKHQHIEHRAKFLQWGAHRHPLSQLPAESIQHCRQIDLLRKYVAKVKTPALLEKHRRALDILVVQKNKHKFQAACMNLRNDIRDRLARGAVQVHAPCAPKPWPAKTQSPTIL